MAGNSGRRLWLMYVVLAVTLVVSCISFPLVCSWYPYLPGRLPLRVGAGFERGSISVGILADGPRPVRQFGPWPSGALRSSLDYWGPPPGNLWWPKFEWRCSPSILGPSDFQTMTLYCPTWIPLGAAIAATVWMRRWGEGRDAFRCRRCGYDLRGLDRGWACPECGTAPRGSGAGGEDLPGHRAAPRWLALWTLPIASGIAGCVAAYMMITAAADWRHAATLALGAPIAFLFFNLTLTLIITIATRTTRRAADALAAATGVGVMTLIAVSLVGYTAMCTFTERWH
ncbi:MAG: hypothetical protein KF745_14140 [Phycisphaeraceae bacterium]|nr:hypothetical protein [Phycisphaeraceae bacterium]